MLPCSPEQVERRLQENEHKSSVSEWKVGGGRGVLEMKVAAMQLTTRKNWRWEMASEARSWCSADCVVVDWWIINIIKQRARQSSCCRSCCFFFLFFLSSPPHQTATPLRRPRKLICCNDFLYLPSFRPKAGGWMEENDTTIGMAIRTVTHLF